MIKATKKDKQKDVIDYPKLMVLPKRGTVVLMSSTGSGGAGHTGTVVIKGYGSFPVGYHCTDWNEFFVDYTGTIELTNEVG